MAQNLFSLPGAKNFVFAKISGTVGSGDTTFNLETGHAAQCPDEGYNELVIYDNGNYPGNPMSAFIAGAAEIFSYTAAPDTGADRLTGITRGSPPVAFPTAGDYRIISPLLFSALETIDDALGVVVTSPRYGADNLGVTASASAINAAADAAKDASGTRAVILPAGVYKIDAPVTFHGPTICIGDVLFDYEGTNSTTAITYRHKDGGSNALGYMTIQVPRVIHDGTVGASDSHVGVKLINLNRCNVFVPHINNFFLALALLNDGLNARGNIITIGELNGWDIGIRCRGEQAGDILRSATFRGGVVASAAFTSLQSGTRTFEVGGGSGDPPQRIVFRDIDIANGTAPEYFLKCYGTKCQFHIPAWPAGADVDFDGSGATSSIIHDAEGSTAIDITESNSASDNIILGRSRQLVTGWTKGDVPGTQSMTTMDYQGHASSGFVAMRPGSIVGISVRGNAARTGGTITVEVYKNGAATGLTTTIDASNAQYNSAIQRAGLDTFTTDDRLEIRYSSSSFTPAGSVDIAASMELVT